MVVLFGSITATEVIFSFKFHWARFAWWAGCKHLDFYLARLILFIVIIESPQCAIFACRRREKAVGARAGRWVGVEVYRTQGSTDHRPWSPRNKCVAKANRAHHTCIATLSFRYTVWNWCRCRITSSNTHANAHTSGHTHTHLHKSFLKNVRSAHHF